MLHTFKHVFLTSFRFPSVIGVLCCLVYSGCTKEHPIDSISIQKKIVVNSLNQVDTPFKFNITSSTFITSNDEPLPIIGTSVRLLDQTTNLSEEVTEIIQGQFVSSFLPISGHTYALTVEAPDFESVSSKITIPQPVRATAISDQPSFYSEKKVHLVDLQIETDPEEELFYLINAYALITDPSGVSEKFLTKVFTVDANTENGDINQNTEDNLAVYIRTNEDLGSEILTTVLPNITDIDNHIAWQAIEVAQVDLIVQIYSVSEGLYKYTKSFEKLQEAGRHIGSLLGIPPTIKVHSNIDGGIGIFGGYTIDSLSFRIY